MPLVRFAHLWLQQRPGTDVALLNGMMHVIMNDGLMDDEFIADRTEGFDENFRKNLQEFTPESAEKITGVPKEKIIEAARIYGRAERAGIYLHHGHHPAFPRHGQCALHCEPGPHDREPGQGIVGRQPASRPEQRAGRYGYGCSPNLYPGYQRVTVPQVRRPL